MSSSQLVDAGENSRAQTYLRDGYVVVSELLGAAEVEELQQDLVRLARGHYPTQALPVISETASDAQVLSHLLCIHQPHLVSPVIWRTLSHPTIAEVLAEIVGAHLGQWWDGSVKCMQSMFFAKPAGKPGQAWHQDEGFIPTRDRSLCGAWIALDDANVENGCLWVLPGSHRAGVLYPTRPHSDPEFDSTPEGHAFNAAGEIPVEVSKGSVVFFNGYLLHRSKRNRTSGSRRALVNHYMSSQSLLPWGKTTEPSTGLEDNRHVVQVVGADPYTWKSTLPADPSQVFLRGEAAQTS